MKGNLGLQPPTAVKLLMMGVATDCSIYPSIGRERMDKGCLSGGSFIGSLVMLYLSGYLYTYCLI